MTITASGSSEALAPPRDGVTLAIATGNRFQRDAPGPGLLGPKVQSGLVPQQRQDPLSHSPSWSQQEPGVHSTSREPRPGELAEHTVWEGKVPKS